jgi:hypothetical protein
MNSVQVKKISNGYIVTTFVQNAAPITGPVETYCADLTAVGTLLAATFAS